MTRARALTLIVIAMIPAARAIAQAPETRPPSTMQQVMQAILFPNANVVFAGQANDPAGFPRDARANAATNPLTGMYGGWQAVENSGLALAESAALLSVAGRSCANGRSVPVAEARWKGAVTALREASLAVATAARARDRERLDAAAEQLIESCGSCHRAYRIRDNQCAAAPAAP
jgi:hypothetical protein